ncbi:MAG: hypothetical protein H6718_15545 [Polyangiaceae bacterium]|nr:hypothetical protein [Polyangiaceae bacterium]MCB9606320.1 hypothetical protein [Polyangiaceae bacterium]
MPLISCSKDLVGDLIQRFAASPPGTVVRCSDQPEQIDRGIVFVLAGWSGPSVRALETFTAELPTLGVPLPLRVVDIDDLPDWLRGLATRFGGWGELVLVESGRVAEIVSLRDADWKARVLQHHNVDALATPQGNR